MANLIILDELPTPATGKAAERRLTNPSLEAHT
jgi:hypothetical protein